LSFYLENNSIQPQLQFFVTFTLQDNGMIEQVAQLSQRYRAAGGGGLVLTKSGRLVLGDNILRAL